MAEYEQQDAMPSTPNTKAAPPIMMEDKEEQEVFLDSGEDLRCLFSSTVPVPDDKTDSDPLGSSTDGKAPASFEDNELDATSGKEHHAADNQPNSTQPEEKPSPSADTASQEPIIMGEVENKGEASVSEALGEDTTEGDSSKSSEPQPTIEHSSPNEQPPPFMRIKGPNGERPDPNNVFYIRPLNLGAAAEHIVTIVKKAFSASTYWTQLMNEFGFKNFVMKASNNPSHTMNLLAKDLNYVTEFLRIGHSEFDLTYIPHDFYKDVMPLLSAFLHNVHSLSMRDGCQSLRIKLLLPGEKVRNRLRRIQAMRIQAEEESKRKAREAMLEEQNDEEEVDEDELVRRIDASFKKDQEDEKMKALNELMGEASLEGKASTTEHGGEAQKVVERVFERQTEDFTKAENEGEAEDGAEGDDDDYDEEDAARDCEEEHDEEEVEADYGEDEDGAERED